MGLLDDNWYQPIEIPQYSHKRARIKGKKRGSKKKKIPKYRRVLPKMTYKQYMGSVYWKKRKSVYFGKYGKVCAVCGKKYGVTLHHKVYRSKLYGVEPDDHLVALCAKHHEEFHKNHNLSADMRKDTDMYVKTMRQVVSSNIDDLSWV